ncbi:helix-turn-helix domain-containing protein [Longispora sp. NPDC051575]|uniref:helix-turn-helix domain-containing protein n=1 Tax=Longispora sp. NPDC051575 TaxID=3154943 RepID=UPI00342864FF
MAEHRMTPLVIPDAFWDQPDVRAALSERDLGAVFHLFRRQLGASQNRIAIAAGLTQPDVSAFMAGRRTVRDIDLLERIAGGLDLPARARHLLGLASPEHADSGQAGPTPAPELTELVAALHPSAAPGDPPASMEPDLLHARTAAAKRDYQACRYSKVVDALPRLLTAFPTRHGDPDTWALAADAYQLATSVLIKLGASGLAMVAADRSLTAAERSGQPVAAMASKRALTHALMSDGHHRAARQVVTGVMNGAVSPGAPPRMLAVYGALVLRGASAAARDEDRATAHQLLDEAAAVARRAGSDGNVHWTGFGPTNVVQHRVSVAVSLGDAGAAIDHARTVRVDQLALVERKAALWLDVARAYLQWGKHHRAYEAVRAAEEVAPEEVRNRSSVRVLVGDLAATAPWSLRARSRQLADRLGVAP